MLTLAQAIIQKNEILVRHYLESGGDVNAVDEFGFTPLIETAIVNDVKLTALLIEHGAEINAQDMVGGTALYWAVENNNLEMARLLLSKGADPNLYNNNGEPLLVKPILRKQTEMKLLLYEYHTSPSFAMDFINAKLLGHRYDLRGSVDIVSPSGDFVEVGFEGFFLEFSLNLVRYSLEEYMKNYVARHASAVFPVLSLCVDALRVAAQLIQFQQYQTKLEDHWPLINVLLDRDLLIIPCNYSGHAITFILHHNTWIKCDRRKIDRATNGISVFKIKNGSAMTKKLMKKIMYEKNTEDFVEKELPKLLNLQLQKRILITPQMSGNCSWANVVACFPAIYYLFSDGIHEDGDSPDEIGEIIDYDHPILRAYRHWRDWDRERTLHYFIHEFDSDDKKRKASIASLLGSVLFQRFSCKNNRNMDMARRIVKILQTPGYEYVLQNYLNYYYHTNRTAAGENIKNLIELCNNYV